MKRELQGRYVTLSTAGERARAFDPAQLPPRPPIDWAAELLGKFDQALLALGHLQQLGIAKELTARKRNSLFSYAGYVEIMNRGTELPGR